jgi:hypothetical protein
LRWPEFQRRTPSRNKNIFLSGLKVKIYVLLLAYTTFILRCEVFMWHHWCYINTSTVWRIVPFRNSIHSCVKHKRYCAIPAMNVKLSLIGWFESTSANGHRAYIEVRSWQKPLYHLKLPLLLIQNLCPSIIGTMEMAPVPILPLPSAPTNVYSHASPHRNGKSY